MPSDVRPTTKLTHDKTPDRQLSSRKVPHKPLSVLLGTGTASVVQLTIAPTQEQHLLRQVKELLTRPYQLHTVPRKQSEQSRTKRTYALRESRSNPPYVPAFSLSHATEKAARYSISDHSSETTRTEQSAVVCAVTGRDSQSTQQGHRLPKPARSASRKVSTSSPNTQLCTCQSSKRRHPS